METQMKMGRLAKALTSLTFMAAMSGVMKGQQPTAAQKPGKALPLVNGALLTTGAYGDAFGINSQTGEFNVHFGKSRATVVVHQTSSGPAVEIGFRDNNGVLYTSFGPNQPAVMQSMRTGQQIDPNFLEPVRAGTLLLMDTLQKVGKTPQENAALQAQVRNQLNNLADAVADFRSFKDTMGQEPGNTPDHTGKGYRAPPRPQYTVPLPPSQYR